MAAWFRVLRMFVSGLGVTLVLFTAGRNFSSIWFLRSRSMTTSPSRPHNHTKLSRDQLLLPTPVIVMGLPKAGTTSIYSYFLCGMQGNLSHYDCQPPENETLRAAGVFGMSCGKRMLYNRLDNRSLFEDIGDWDLLSELDAPYNHASRGMILPQWQWITEIHDRYPNATWILNTRNPVEWIDSINRWQDLRQRFIDSDYPPEFPKGVGQTDQEMIGFYQLQAQRIRDFTEARPDQQHHLVELQIDSPHAGRVLEAAFGISQHCWGQRNKNKGDAAWNKD